MLKFILAVIALSLLSCTQKKEEVLPVEEVIVAVEKPENIVNGDFIEHHPNGNIKTKGILKNGKRVGVWISYHKNGNVYSENKYEKGLLNGKTAAYYPNGNVQYMGLYVNGKKDDSWFFYLEDGTFEKEILFKDGEKTKTTP